MRKSLLIGSLSGLVLIAIVMQGQSSRAPASLPPFLVHSILNSQINVVGGTVVDVSDPLASHTVRLIKTDTDGALSICTGSVLSSSIVLTAAHCLPDNTASVQIEFRALAPSSSEVPTRMVDRFWTHPQHQGVASSNGSDLALVHFTGGLPPGAVPIEIYKEGFATVLPQNSEILTSTIAGYGRTTPGVNDTVDLYKTELAMKERYLDMILLEPHSDAPPSSACHGDSGGPAFIEFKGQLFQWGVAMSVTRPFCKSGSYYTDLNPHLSILARAMKALDQKQD